MGDLLILFGFSSFGISVWPGPQARDKAECGPWGIGDSFSTLDLALWILGNR